MLANPLQPHRENSHNIAALGTRASRFSHSLDPEQSLKLPRIRGVFALLGDYGSVVSASIAAS